jgi:DNA-directed RNA polymerase subunit RPC12/RpoP
MKQAKETAMQNVIRQEQQRIMQEEMDSIVNGAGKGFKKGAFSGGMLLLMGLAVMWIPIIGMFMAFTLILSAMASPFVSGIMGAEQGAGKGRKRLIYGKCPYCSGRLCVTVAADSLEKYVGLDCPLCRKRFLAKGKVFLRVPPLPVSRSNPAG